MLETTYDIIVVGAGIAGSSSAIALAPEGYRLLLVDRAVFPRDKPCGEGIMPQGVEVLAQLGVLSAILDSGARTFRGIRYRNRQGVLAQAEFPRAEGGVAFGVAQRRYHLDHLLVQRATSFANVTVREGFAVTEVLREGDAVRGIVGHPVDSPSQRLVFRAPLTIGADGRHSLFHAACGLTKVFLRRRRYGVTGHLRSVAGIGPYVEVLPHQDGEIYLAPCGEDVTLVALLLEERAMKFFKGDLSRRYLESLRSTEGFGSRIARAELVPPVYAVGPLGFTVDPCYRPGLLLIGDSAGFLDPITGEGMALALKSVKAAVPLISEAFAHGDFGTELGRRYAEKRLELIGDLVRFTRLLLALSRHKFIADRAVRRLSRDERLFRNLLAIATGASRYSDLSLSQKVSLLLG